MSTPESSPISDGPTPADLVPGRGNGPVLGRRGLLRGTSLAALAVGGTLGGIVAAAPRAAAANQTPEMSDATRAAQSSTSTAPAGSFTPLRPPATPLAVRSPYLSTWLAGDSLAGTWSSF